MEVCDEIRPFPASVVTLALGYPLSQGYQQANTKCCVRMHGCRRGFKSKHSRSVADYCESPIPGIHQHLPLRPLL